MPPAEMLDAAAALQACEEDPSAELWRHVLRLTLARSRDERARFDRVFDAFLAAHRPPRLARRPRPAPPAGGAEAGTTRGATSSASTRHALPHPEAQAPRPDRHTPRQHAPPQHPDRNTPCHPHPSRTPGEEERAKPRGGEPPPTAPPQVRPRAELAQAIDPDELLRLLRWVEARLDDDEDEVRAEDPPARPPAPPRTTPPEAPHGPHPRHRHGPVPLPSHLPDHVLTARVTPEDELHMLAIVRAMAAQVWLRRSRRSRRWKSGRVDVKATMARGLRSGGLAFRLVRRRRRLRRARLVLLLDVSGSVRRAARFVLALASAMKSAFAGARAFLFVDRPVEVTASLDQEALDDPAAWEARWPEVDWMGRSDFGHAFFHLLEQHEGALRKDTLLVILGDARNNGQDPMTWTLGAIRNRVGHIVWLNPEPRARWDTGDSVLSAYAPWCDAVEPCERVADLGRVAARWTHLSARWRQRR